MGAGLHEQLDDGVVVEADGVVQGAVAVSAGERTQGQGWVTLHWVRQNMRCVQKQVNGPRESSAELTCTDD